MVIDFLKKHGTIAATYFLKLTQAFALVLLLALLAFAIGSVVELAMARSSFKLDF